MDGIKGRPYFVNTQSSGKLYAMSATPSSTPPSEKTIAAEFAAYRRLRIWNGSLALLHAAQAIVIIALSNSFTLPVTLSFLKGPPGTKPG